VATADAHQSRTAAVTTFSSRVMQFKAYPGVIVASANTANLFLASLERFWVRNSYVGAARLCFLEWEWNIPHIAWQGVARSSS